MTIQHEVAAIMSEARRRAHDVDLRFCWGGLSWDDVRAEMKIIMRDNLDQIARLISREIVRMAVEKAVKELT